jgi:hypothetical protein
MMNTVDAGKGHVVKGAVERVAQHLQRYGTTPVPTELRPDIEAIKRRARIVASNPELRHAGFEVELSPYMRVLLQLPTE